MQKQADDLFFSIIIPVYNRPDEVEELLQSLTSQEYTKFEVVIIEDGSSIKCEQIVKSYQDQLDIRYFYKQNSGQGFSRNIGFKKAKGDYFVIFDSDCLIPPHYFATLNEYLQSNWLDAYGGPDKAHPSFSKLQKAISYSMTSPLTTGGIRGNEQHSGTFHPRSFNMGISRKVWEQTSGFKITRMGEDIEFSIRIIEHGFITGLIPQAFVYHKRRTSLHEFYNQLHFFGRARINISRFYPSQIKWIHALPSAFVVGLLIWLSLFFWAPNAFKVLGLLGLSLFLVLGAHATVENKSSSIGLLSMVTSFIQLTAYGIGFMTEYVSNRKSKNDTF